MKMKFSIVRERAATGPRIVTLNAAWRVAAGLALLAALGALGFEFYRDLAQRDAAIAGALFGGSVAFAATALGTLPVLLSHSVSQRAHDTMLGFGAGVMLAASAFSLVLPAIEAAGALGHGRWASGLITAAGIVAGGLLLMAIDRFVPHEHFIKGVEGPRAMVLRRTWLFVFAITLHNLPEGLAIGVAYAGSDHVGAQALATGISIQDVPEGLVVALALRCIGYGRWLAAGLGAVSGLIEPIAAVGGAALIGLSASLLPWGLAMAAGAMLFVISHEVIPESHRRGHETYATSGLMLGFVIMMLLDTALG